MLRCTVKPSSNQNMCKLSLVQKFYRKQLQVLAHSPVFLQKGNQIQERHRKPQFSVTAFCDYRALVTCFRLQLTFHCFKPPKNENVIVIISHPTSNFPSTEILKLLYNHIHSWSQTKIYHTVKQRKTSESQTKPLVSRFPQTAAYTPCLI